MPSHNHFNILIITSIYPDSKEPHVGTFVANWAEQLKGAGVNVMVYKRDHITFGSYVHMARVLSFFLKPRVYTYTWHGVPVCRQGIHLRFPLNYSTSAPNITYKKIKPTIARIYDTFPFDLIYLATWGDLSLAMSWIAKEINIPYIASAIGDHTTLYFDKPGSRYYKLERETYLGSELVLCVSRDMEKKVNILTDSKANTKVFYSGVDTKKFQPFPTRRQEYRRRLGYSGKDLVLLFIGRVTKEKGVYELLEAFSRLANDHESLQLLLIGPVFEQKKVEQAMSRLEVRDRVTIIEGVDHDEIPCYMNAADLFVFPSWMEGLPNVVMEACACGLPVIASSVGGIPELIEDDVTGFLVSPQSPEELAEKVVCVTKDMERARTVAKAARLKMLREFNYHKNGWILFDRVKSIITRSKDRYPLSMT